MGLKAITKKVYLKIKDGRIAMRNLETGADELYKSVSGFVTGIYEREADINGEKITFLEIALKSDGDDYVLSVPKNGGLARTIILSLASIDDFANTPLEFMPYTSKEGKYNNLSIYANGEKVPWVCGFDELPPLKYIKLTNGKEIPDDGLRQSFLEEMLDNIRKNISGGGAEDLDDMPA